MRIMASVQQLGDLFARQNSCLTIKDIIEKLFTWFCQTEIKAKLGKRHMLLSTTEQLNFQISETIIQNLHSKKLLGITFDDKLNFENHTNTICQKTYTKLNALARITP